MKTCALELDHVSAGYEQNRVIEDLSLTVAEGEMAALLGPNGAGKSTLLRTLTGLLKPLADVVSLFGADVTSLPDPAVFGQCFGRCFKISS